MMGSVSRGKRRLSSFDRGGLSVMDELKYITKALGIKDLFCAPGK
jgi:hypothetical protein